MCLAIPGKVTEVFEDGGLHMARVSFDGVVRKVCMECVPDARPGEYVLVHVGFALGTIDEAEAERVFSLLRELEAPEEFSEVGA